MPVTIRIPTALRQYVDQQKDIQAEGATIGSLLEDLIQRYPAIRKNLFDDSGTLRNFVVVYVDDEDIRYLKGLDTRVSEDSLVAIAASIAGG